MTALAPPDDLNLGLVSTSNDGLPRRIAHVHVPPIKSQGIKTKLVPFIARSIDWDGRGRWFEPFLGSGVVLFNIRPERALATDSNPHLIRFYADLAAGGLDSAAVRNHLESRGHDLAAGGADFYYEIRETFNQNPTSLDFLFLNRSCFNGLIRFSKKGRFNVPFGHKPNRFAPAYVTKIVNQVRRIQDAMADRDWRFEVMDWRDALETARNGDFVYADPPYSGRFSDFYNRWGDGDLGVLHERLVATGVGYALSTWLENRYRRNEHFDFDDSRVVVRTAEHFYHLGATEQLRGAMTEALVIGRSHAAPL